MGKKIFIFKELNSEDRDIVNYIERPTFDCGHYFGSMNLQGACFSKQLRFRKHIKTILTCKDIKKLIDIDNKISELKYNIKIGSKKYKQGLKLLEELEPIFNKLESKENQELFIEVIEEEKEYLKEEYNLDDIELQEIFDEYYLEYKDRGIIGRVYDDSEELGKEEAENYIEGFDKVEKYFDYEAFADDLLNEESYLELSSGKCVRLNY